jgi:hypothetical protein
MIDKYINVKCSNHYLNLWKHQTALCVRFWFSNLSGWVSLRTRHFITTFLFLVVQDSWHASSCNLLEYWIIVQIYQTFKNKDLSYLLDPADWVFSTSWLFILSVFFFWSVTNIIVSLICMFLGSHGVMSSLRHAVVCWAESDGEMTPSIFSARMAAVRLTFACPYLPVSRSPEGRPGDFWCLPPVWNLRAASLIPLFYISSLVLPSPAAISVLPFSAFGPFSWSVFP